MKHTLAVLALCGVLVAAAPPHAVAEESPESEDPGELAREGVERLLRALEAVIDMVPQYEMPEINENGDIIIRRKRGPEAAPDDEQEEPDIDQTRT